MRVLVIDDDPIVCSSLKMILESDSEITVVGTGTDGDVAIELFDLLSPDILLMDIRMQPRSGLSAGEIILANHPDAYILYLTTFSDNDYIIKALSLGAKGYLLKQNFDSIIPSLKAIFAGQNVFGNEIVTKLPDIILSKEKSSFCADHSLSDKENELLTYIAKGLNNKEIASIIHLSEGTVRNYISELLEKLQLRDRTQLAIFYYQHLRK